MSIKIEGFKTSLAGVTGGLVYKGTLDPASPPANITSALKGDWYLIKLGGTLAGVSLSEDDHIVFNQDASNPLTSAMFDKIDNTENPASETVAGVIEISTNAEATAGTATNKALVPSNLSSIGTSQLNNDSGFITSGLQSGDNVSELVNDSGYLTTVAAASTTVAGKIEIATNAEATAGTATDKALVPSNLSSIGTSQLNNDSGFITSVAAASETVAGKIEISTNAEATAGTATDKALVPSNLSSIGTSQLNNDSGFITSGLQSGDNVSELVNDSGYLTTVAAASETVAGKIEISTNAEATAGTATDKALVPSNLSSIGTSQLNNDSGFITSGLQSGDNVSELVNDSGYLTTVAAASTTVAGKIEIATNAEATAGTATDKALVPSNLSSIGTSQLNNDSGFITSGLQSGDNVSELVNDSGYLTTVAAASTTVAGKIEISTNAEATAGTATDKALVPSNISSIDLNQLDEISYTAGVGINGQVLTYVHANNQWEAAAASGGGFTYNSITSASSPVTAAVSNHYGSDTSGGAIVFNLPALSGLSGGEEIRVKLNTAGNDLTITANGSDTIEGVGNSTYVMSITKESVTCVADSGTNWEVI
jgi:predicted methyltransferase